MEAPEFNFEQTDKGLIRLWVKINDRYLCDSSKVEMEIKNVFFSFAVWHGDHRLISVDGPYLVGDDRGNGLCTFKLLLRPSHYVLPGFLASISKD